MNLLFENMFLYSNNRYIIQEGQVIFHSSLPSILPLPSIWRWATDMSGISQSFSHRMGVSQGTWKMLTCSMVRCWLGQGAWCQRRTTPPHPQEARYSFFEMGRGFGGPRGEAREAKVIDGAFSEHRQWLFTRHFRNIKYLYNQCGCSGTY